MSKTERIDRLLNALGYIESRRLAARLLRNHEILHKGVPVKKTDEKVAHADVTLDGKPLDPPQGMVILLHKPVGYVCSHEDSGLRIYDLLPPRFKGRTPALNSVGRLDKDASGLLLLTDDGKLLQQLTNPRQHVAKTYHVTLADPLRGDEQAVFAKGDLMLRSEDKPLLPAHFEALSPTTGHLTLHEGRYHQVKRMFGALGNKVVGLARIRMGDLTLGDTPEGQWRILEEKDLMLLTKKA